jgi:hypothetical protein
MQRHTLSRISRYFAPLVLAACADTSPVLQSEPAEPDQAVLERLRELGLPTHDVELAGEFVRVGGDQNFRRDALLAGAYEERAPEPDAIEKGYSIKDGAGRNVRVPDPGIASNIRLAFDSGTPRFVRDAFIAAAGDFNSIPNSSLRISQNNTGPTITIVWYTSLWGLANCRENLAACSDYPLYGDPGARIHVKGYDVDPDCPDWTPSMLAFMARHELGHALGLMHPNDGLGDAIFDTAECVPTPAHRTQTIATCPLDPGYATIMVAGMPLNPRGCLVSPSVLQTDDRRSLAELY